MNIPKAIETTININGRDITGLIDTGCNLTTIPKTMADSSGIEYTYAGKTKVDYADKTRKVDIWVADVTVKFLALTKTMKVIIIEHSGEPLFGLDLLQKFHIVINVQTRSLSSTKSRTKVKVKLIEANADKVLLTANKDLTNLKQRKIFLKELLTANNVEDKNKNLVIYADDDYVIPASTTMYIGVKFKKHKEKIIDFQTTELTTSTECEPYMTNPSLSYFIRSQTMVPRGTIDSSTQVLPMTNFGRKEVRVKKNTSIAFGTKCYSKEDKEQSKEDFVKDNWMSIVINDVLAGSNKNIENYPAHFNPSNRLCQQVVKSVHRRLKKQRKSEDLEDIPVKEKSKNRYNMSNYAINQSLTKAQRNFNFKSSHFPTKFKMSDGSEEFQPPEQFKSPSNVQEEQRISSPLNPEATEFKSGKTQTARKSTGCPKMAANTEEQQEENTGIIPAIKDGVETMRNQQQSPEPMDEEQNKPTTQRPSLQEDPKLKGPNMPIVKLTRVVTMDQLPFTCKPGLTKGHKPVEAPATKDTGAKPKQPRAHAQAAGKPITPPTLRRPTETPSPGAPLSPMDYLLPQSPPKQPATPPEAQDKWQTCKRCLGHGIKRAAIVGLGSSHHCPFAKCNCQTPCNSDNAPKTTTVLKIISEKFKKITPPVIGTDVPIDQETNEVQAELVPFGKHFIAMGEQAVKGTATQKEIAVAWIAQSLTAYAPKLITVRPEDAPINYNWLPRLLPKLSPQVIATAYDNFLKIVNEEEGNQLSILYTVDCVRKTFVPMYFKAFPKCDLLIEYKFVIYHKDKEILMAVAYKDNVDRYDRGQKSRTFTSMSPLMEVLGSSDYNTRIKGIYIVRTLPQTIQAALMNGQTRGYVLKINRVKKGKFAYKQPGDIYDVNPCNLTAGDIARTTIFYLSGNITRVIYKTTVDILFNWPYQANTQSLLFDYVLLAQIPWHMVDIEHRDDEILAMATSRLDHWLPENMKTPSNNRDYQTDRDRASDFYGPLIQETVYQMIVFGKITNDRDANEAGRVVQEMIQRRFKSQYNHWSSRRKLWFDTKEAHPIQD
ncbi:hypothetical protein HDE_13308 [Halotydeus destructor]|nr:hypothetical protein HDE_13308 [Halotydeus destructor]